MLQKKTKGNSPEVHPLRGLLKLIQNLRGRFHFFPSVVAFAISSFSLLERSAVAGMEHFLRNASKSSSVKIIWSPIRWKGKLPFLRNLSKVSILIPRAFDALLLLKILVITFRTCFLFFDFFN